MMLGTTNIKNEIYLFIKHTKRVLRIVAKRLSYTEDARCLKVNQFTARLLIKTKNYFTMNFKGELPVHDKRIHKRHMNYQLSNEVSVGPVAQSV